MVRASAASLLAALLTLGLALGGCVDGGDDDQAETIDAAATSNAVSNPRPSVGTGRAPAAAEGAAESPPAYQIGDWWTWRVRAADNVDQEVTVAVAGVDAAAYWIGASDESALLATLPTHAFPLGRQDATTMGWDAHHATLPLLRFPLEDGASWTADGWLGPELVITLHEEAAPAPHADEPAFRVSVDYAAGGTAMQAWWSVARASFLRVEVLFGAETPFTQAELIAMGRGGAAATFVPIVTDLVRHQWSFAPDPSFADRAPPRTFAVPGDADLVLVACWMGGGPGAFSMAVNDPGGEVTMCHHSNEPNDSATVLQTGIDEPASGQWSAAGLSTGLGASSMEVFGITWWTR